MQTVNRLVSYGRKDPRDLSVNVDIPSDIQEWVSALSEDGVMEVLTTYAKVEVDKELARIMSRNPDLTQGEAEKHFKTLFKFNADMGKVEKAAKLRAQLEALSTS